MVTAERLRRDIEYLKARQHSRRATLAIPQDRLQFAAMLGIEPDPWQVDLLTSESRRVLLNCCRQCLDGDTVIFARDGRALRLRHHPGAWATGSKPTKRYVMRGGASFVATDTHPIFTETGWSAAGALRIGDKVSALREWDCWEGVRDIAGEVEHGSPMRARRVSVSFALDEDVARVLGYVSTDGSHRPGQSIKFTNTNPAYLAEMATMVERSFGVRAKWYPKGRGFDLLFTTTKARHDNPFMDFMRAVSWDEGFPVDVFRFPRSLAAEFINRAFSSDGCVRMNRGRPEASLACKNSEVYARYHQALLAKLGIGSRVVEEWHTKSTRPFYRLVLNPGAVAIRKFIKTVGLIHGKEENSRAMLRYCDERLDPSRWRRKPHEDHGVSHVGVDGEAFFFAPVVRIDDAGEREVWDVSVPGKGWFVAGGAQVHNSGKSTMSALLALHRALTSPGSLVLALAPALRQSQELFAKIADFYSIEGALYPIEGYLYPRPGHTVPSDSRRKLGMALANGSRIEALPGSERTVRGFSGVDPLILDEASRVDDALYFATRPMLAVSGGSLIMLSTPNGKRGAFFEEWDAGGAGNATKSRPRRSRASPRSSLPRRGVLCRRGCSAKSICAHSRRRRIRCSHTRT